ncbi:alpha/beta fold hydrolase [Streptomyces sp. NBC_00582]|uniref:alpha/beta fold hydrolase n=1 Tax=Streptomyces sp. NBC_00582 TaxID=2975783 RepID=UPI002E80D12C|nr:alpha/beta hydrolase [Streptomyces sp. NBC_00582]WUB60034.1 alpha/beta hydrolase [Streptomyces sp. NBC_00582]
MTHFVLVPGAFLGAWAWDEVAARLRAAGDEAHPLTLSGLAEKAGVPAGQQTHVRDVVAEVERLGVRDVVLVGHSYSGIPVGQAAERLGDRLARVVYVDASVPFTGESFLSGWDSDHVRAAIEANAGVWPPLGADDCVGQDLTDEQIAGVLARATAHPGATLTEPAELEGSAGDLPSTYIKCLLDGDAPPPAVAELLKGDTWELVEMDTGHWPMFSRPAELARILRASVAAHQGV